MAICSFIHLVTPVILLVVSGADAAVFTLQNNCGDTIWPGILSGAGQPPLMNGGLSLNPGKSVRIDADKEWSCRFWGCRGCSFDKTGKGDCTTGDCGGKLEGAGTGGAPPATFAEFTQDSPDDFYDVSLVDGYNMLISIVPSASGGSSGLCKEVRCISDLNRQCPQKIQVRGKAGRVVGCKSACMAYGTPEYCCKGQYGNPNTCKPTNYSKLSKLFSPSAYSYAYDDPTSTVTCKGANFLITFC